MLVDPNRGISNYNAFTLKSEHRFHNGTGWLVAYTYSKWIDNVPFFGGSSAAFGDAGGIQNLYNLAGERSASANDVPHRVVLSPILELPSGSG